MERVPMSEVPAWFEQALQDSQVTDICINGGSMAFLDRGEGLEPLAGVLASPWCEEGLRAWLIAQLSGAGKTWDARHPFVDATLPSGHRLHAAFPPMSPQGTLVSLRRRAPRLAAVPGESLARRWAEHAPRAAALLIQAISNHETILVSGATGSGKTTLVSDLLELVPPAERIVALEDTPEIAPFHPHFVALVSRPASADGAGEVTLRALLRQALRMRPDRLLLGECRGPEVLDLLQALNSGHRGTLATVHANSARDALRRLELLCWLASGGGQGSAGVGAIRELLAVGIQWIVHVARDARGRRGIAELNRVEGREGDTILLRPMIQIPHAVP